MGNSSNWVECFLDEDGITNSRKKYPGIGDNYNSATDIFYPRQPYPSWTLDEETCRWDAPVAYPDDGNEYNWNESTKAWDEKE